MNNQTSTICIAICTFNSGHYLTNLIDSIQQQNIKNPFEILVVDNNSNDNTADIITDLSKQAGVNIRYVFEHKQGIAHARNRAINECRNFTYLAFIDADEIPSKNWLKSAIHSLEHKKADCVGGKIKLTLPGKTPKWLTTDLKGFLGYLDHGDKGFFIKNSSTPIWTGNVAYRINIFNGNTEPFDIRYNRAGNGIGGGEDKIMLETLLENNHRLYYAPEMIINHIIPPAKTKRRYFLKLHYKSGKQSGRFSFPYFRHSFLGVPPYLIAQLIRQLAIATKSQTLGKTGSLRQWMICTHTFGIMYGLREKRTLGNTDE